MTALPCLQVTPTEEGLRYISQLVKTYPQGFMFWQGPVIPIILLCHPDMVRVVTNASGIHTRLMVVGAVAHLRLPAPPCHASVKPMQDLGPLTPSLPAICFSYHVFKSAFSLQCCLSPTLVSWAPFGASRGFKPTFCPGGILSVKEMNLNSRILS